MTEFELIEAMLGYQEVGVGHLMNFVSILFAYLVCGYLVGGRLTRLQLWIINGLFTFFSLAAAIGTYVSLNRSFDLIGRLVSEFPAKDGGPIMSAPPPAEGAIVVFLFIVVAYAAGVVFMRSTRTRVSSPG